MTSYQTCLGCAVDRNSCSIRANVKAGIKGLGLTSVKFKCTGRVALFQPGERVYVTWNIPDYANIDWYGEADWMPESWPATVVQESAERKFVIKVDDVNSDEGRPAKEWIKNQNLFCKVKKSKLSRIAEPHRSICEKCMEPMDADEKCRSNYCIPSVDYF